MRPSVLILLIALSSACAARPAPAVPERYADLAAYRAARERLIAEERALRLGANLPLTAVNRTGFIGGLFPREDGAHGTTQ